MTYPERRSESRYQVKPDTFVYFYPPGSEPSTIQNLSLGGMYIEDKSSQPSEGTELKLKVRVKNNELIALRGVVTRVNPSQGFAVRFLEYSGDLKELLKERFQLAGGSESGPREIVG
jgi:hypothetical protein